MGTRYFDIDLITYLLT